jgi:nucleotide-binding universal stress UspA family protein
MREGPVIVAYDGSEGADRALREAAPMLGGRPVLIVVVWEEGVAYEALATTDIQAAPLDPRIATLTDEALYEGARRTAGKGVGLADELGLRAEGLAVTDHSNVALTLVDLAKERDASAIVVGSRGHNRFERLFLGSTSRHVLEHAPCPVIVVGAAGR